MHRPEEPHDPPHRPRLRCPIRHPHHWDHACSRPSGPVAARQASPTAGTPCPATSEEENAALVRRYLEEAYNGRNPALADELLADHFVRHNAAAPHRDQVHGNTDDVARVEAWLTAFPDLHIAIEKLITADDTVVGLLIWRGTHDGPLPHWDAPVTGQAMERESVVIYRVECGQIAENWIVAGQPDDAAPVGDHHR